MTSDNHDGWDSFDWQNWGGGEPSSDGNVANGHQRGDGSDERRARLDEEEVEADRPQGKWVSQGGVMRWETPDDEESAPSLQDEARSPFADDDFALPAGAPDAARVRAVRAWLARQRQLAGEAIGFLLMERRLQSAESGREPTGRASAEERDDPLELALAEHQMAMQEYELLIEALDEILTHSGPARALIEYHLWLTERLAQVAREPEAPASFAAQLLQVEIEDEEQAAGSPRHATTPRSHAEWQGRAEAGLRTRRRVEWVTAPETEE